MKLFEGFTFVPGLVMIDNSQLMVAGFYQPLKKINIENLMTSPINIPEEDQKACIRRSVFIPTALHKDTYGTIWIGTVSNGLMRYHPETNRMTVSYTHLDVYKRQGQSTDHFVDIVGTQSD